MTTIIKDNFISKCIQQVWPGRTITWCNISISSLTCHSCVQTTPPQKKTTTTTTNKQTNHTQKKKPTNYLVGIHYILKLFPTWAIVFVTAITAVIIVVTLPSGTDTLAITETLKL